MTPDDVLAFWFEDDASQYREKWFQKDVDFDASCTRFSDALRSAKAGALDHWCETQRGTLALIILLDQFSRNLHRDSAEAFAADTKARSLARAAVAQGLDQSLTSFELTFLYLPFEHSELLADQDELVRLFTPLGEDLSKYAVEHRDVIKRFGRFPHRNAALGRECTPEEIAYLAEPDAGF